MGLRADVAPQENVPSHRQRLAGVIPGRFSAASLGIMRDRPDCRSNSARCGAVARLGAKVRGSNAKTSVLIPVSIWNAYGAGLAGYPRLPKGPALFGAGQVARNILFFARPLHRRR